MAHYPWLLLALLAPGCAARSSPPEAAHWEAAVRLACRFCGQHCPRWGLGYMTDVSMFCCMVLMGLPLGTSKVVEALGGRGAWARKAEPPPPEEPSSKTQAKKQARAAAAADAQPPQPSLAGAPVA